MRHPLTVALLVTLVLGLQLPAAHAEAKRKAADAGPALARAQALLKQVAAQKAQVEAELAKLKEDSARRQQESQAQVDKLKGDVKDTQTSLEESKATLQEAQQSNLSLGSQLKGTRDRLGKTEERLKEVIAKYKETDQALQQTRAEKADLDARLAAQVRLTEDAEAKNLKLYQANVELLDHYEKKGVKDALLQAEPFTGIKRVEMENIREEYGYKLDQLRINHPAADTSVVPPSAPPSASP